MPPNLALKRAQKLTPGKGHFYQENVNLYLNFVKGTTAIADGAVE